jgi:formamidopyrimidine-DNA glycosylase
MPELPEVEVTRRGIDPHVAGQVVTAVAVRNAALRWPVPADLEATLKGRTLRTTARRGKYLLLHFDHGHLLVHLGMSGSLRVLPADTPPRPHEHVDIVFGPILLRLHDPRRFGAVLWHDAATGLLQSHALLTSLGLEPFDPAFDGDHLYRQTRKRSAAIKQVLLAGDVVVGVGNIYASEALFRARIRPTTAASSIGRERYATLAATIRATLREAIEKGGSTLRDFVRADGASGYFQLEYFVYDREGQPCRHCGTPIRAIRQGQRSTFFCPQCQRR